MYEDHSEEWPSGLCKKCYPENPPRMMYNEFQPPPSPTFAFSASMLPRCSVPTGAINFSRAPELRGNEKRKAERKKERQEKKMRK